VLADIVEKRVRDGKGSWRRKGVSIFDRELETWHESILLEKPKDYQRFVPFKRSEVFTSSLLAQRAKITADMAGKALYVLTKLNVVKRTGKKGRCWLYKKKPGKIPGFKNFR
jgi:ribosomal protein S25